VISLTPSCTLAASGTGTATGTMAADILDIKEKLEEIKNGTYWANQGVDVPTDPTAATGVPAFTNGPSGYLMALNIATNDGHMVHYGNDNFWESQTGTGGATGSSALRWTKDFKDTTVFNMAADQIMVAVHVDGVVKAWREYHASNKGASLQSYLANPRFPVLALALGRSQMELFLRLEKTISIHVTPCSATTTNFLRTATTSALADPITTVSVPSPAQASATATRAGALVPGTTTLAPPTFPVATPSTTKTRPGATMPVRQSAVSSAPTAPCSPARTARSRATPTRTLSTSSNPLLLNPSLRVMKW